MKCPTHIKYFNDEKYLVSGAFETYEAIRMDGKIVRVCKACYKKIELERQNGRLPNY